MKYPHEYERSENDNQENAYENSGLFELFVVQLGTSNASTILRPMAAITGVLTAFPACFCNWDSLQTAAARK